jgi:transcriptional antiterminator RfaH
MTQLDGWYLARSRFRSEFAAETVLEKREHEVYLPRVLKSRSHARRHDFVERPFLDGYLFVRRDERGSEFARQTLTISGLVRMGSGVMLIAQAVIDALRSREIVGFNGRRYIPVMDDAFHVRDDIPWVPKHGDPVRMKSGTMQGFHVIFDMKEGTDRAQVFIDYMRRSVVMHVAMADLEPCK